MELHPSLRFDATQRPLTPMMRYRLDELCQAAKALDQQAAIPGSSGNFSLRCSNNTFWISRSGLHKRNLKPQHFLQVDLSTSRPLFTHAPKPSDETELHTWLYNIDASLKCVMHCHARPFEALQSPGAKLQGHEMLKIFAFPDHQHELPLRVVSNSQRMEEIIKELEKSPPSVPCFMIEKHGMYVGGRTIQETLARMEALIHLIACGHYV